MAQSKAQATQSARAQAAKAPAAKPAALKPASAEKPAEKPVVALVPDPPAEPKRRGRPPGPAPAKRPRKTNAGGVLFLVETEADSGLFKARDGLSMVEVLELGDAGRKVITTRKWREF